MTRVADVAENVVAGLSARIAHRSDAPVPRAPRFDLERYLGPWHVIAAIPLPPEIGAHNPLETYRLTKQRRIATTYAYRKDSFSGPFEVKSMTADVVAGSGDAEWKVQLIGPVGSQYVVAFVEDDYSGAIVARDARDYVWILSRTPALAPQKLAEYQDRIETMGYDISKLVQFAQNGQMPSA